MDAYLQLAAQLVHFLQELHPVYACLLQEPRHAVRHSMEVPDSPAPTALGVPIAPRYHLFRGRLLRNRGKGHGGGGFGHGT